MQNFSQQKYFKHYSKMDAIPLEVGVGPEQQPSPKLVSYCHVNLGYDELHQPRSRSHSTSSIESHIIQGNRNICSRRSSVTFTEKINYNYSSDETASHDFFSNSPEIKIGDLDYVFDIPPSPKLQRKAAVTVRNAIKQYGQNHPYVLNDFGMTIPRGTIYSLLGSSGCGKTTVLMCILGLRNLKSGNISIFGARPGTAESGVPGKRVGYMPQETALYKDFSIDETLHYYGTLFGMSKPEIKKSRDFLMSFLNLPDKTKMVGTLSGGQQRRVSLAVSLIHSPDLLVLDEPTVGVDALLRINIWNHLVHLVETKQTTILITTHYIEEARQSNTIGLMRGGRLLEENSPEALMKEHNAVLLEDIVLKLCQKDKFVDNDGHTKTSKKLEEVNEKEDVEDLPPYDARRRSSVISIGRRKMSMFQMEKKMPKGTIKDSLARLKALTLKNIYTMVRNYLMVLFMILVPSMMIVIICLGIGNDPKPMKMGVVNLDTNYSECLTSSNWNEVPPDEDGCDIENLSCKYLSKLPPDIVHLIEYETVELAKAAVTEGDCWGYLLFPEGYSDNVYVRASSGNIIDDSALDGSFIFYQMDMSSKQIAGTLKRILHDGYKDFTKELLANCGFNTKLAESPVKALTPIYGTDDTDFREFIAPSLLLGLLFFFPLCSSSIQYLMDKKQGTLERAEVAGVKTWEIMMAFFITEGVILLIQSGLTMLIITAVFGIAIRGSAILAVCLAIMMGLGGVSMGFLIGSFCNEEVEAVMLAMASFFPNTLISGLIWPIEGMPIVMQYISYLLPCTFAAESMRSIVSRGWGFTHVRVWPGFVSMFAWICFYWLITICIHKIVLKRK